MAELAAEALRRITAVPGVSAATWAAAPSTVEMHGGVLVDTGNGASTEKVSMGLSTVDASYFRVIGLDVISGRSFTADDPRTAVVIPQSMARRFWPTERDAIGRSFRLSTKFSLFQDQPSLDVVGVVADIQSDPRRPSTSQSYFFYGQRQPPPPPPPSLPVPGAPVRRVVDTGGSWRFLALTARVDDPSRADAVLAAARSVDSRLRVTVEPGCEKYAVQFADVLLSTRVVSAFGLLAFAVAIVGVYGVLSFLVAGRTREIGIRMALGADRRDIRRLVQRSSLTMIGTGMAIGFAAALAVSHWLSSQLYGVTATDPATYFTVAAVIFVTALIATWRPAARASRVDPAITLRSE
jgi:hypothetical protein